MVDARGKNEQVEDTEEPRQSGVPVREEQAPARPHVVQKPYEFSRSTISLASVHGADAHQPQQRVRNNRSNAMSRRNIQPTCSTTQTEKMTSAHCTTRHRPKPGARHHARWCVCCSFDSHQLGMISFFLSSCFLCFVVFVFVT